MIGVVMGSQSDWRVMEFAAITLGEFGVPCECMVVSAHRTPDLLYEYARSAEERGLKMIIAGAGGSAHLPGMLASLTCVPVLGVPIVPGGSHFGGVESLLSIVQMPRGVPVPTLSLNGAENAALFAVAVLATNDAGLRGRLGEWRRNQTRAVLRQKLPLGGKAEEDA